MKISAARRHRQTINSPSYRLFVGCCRLITADAFGQRNNSFSSAGYTSRRRKLSGGAKTPHPTQFHGIVTSPPMLQLGDKGARQCKKNFSQAQASATLDGPSQSSDGHLANSNRPEAYFDALTPSDARFLRLSKLEAAWPVQHYGAIFTGR